MSDSGRYEKFEKMFKDIYGQQKQISQELAQLRSQGKEKTCRFRELMSKKLSNSYVISLYQLYGLEENAEGGKQ